MEQYIPKSALLAEIKRRIEKCDTFYDIALSNNAELAKVAIEEQKRQYSSLLSFLDTLEVKEVDLDYIKDELDRVIKIHKPDGDFGWGTLYNVATHFFELGLKAQKGE